MNQKKSFWATLPGIITGIAGLITAIGGLLLILYQIGAIGPAKETVVPNVIGLSLEAARTTLSNNNLNTGNVQYTNTETNVPETVLSQVPVFGQQVATGTTVTLVVSRRAAGEVEEDCISFDHNKAEVKKVGGRWKIVAGNKWLLGFNNNESEARQALQIIKHYRMNKQCFVGRPDASMEYYLVNGQSPTGAFQGEDCLGFNPANIEVKEINGRWKIVEGSRWILDFEDKKNEARQSFNIIKKYGFRYICFVVRPDASMIYFRR